MSIICFITAILFWSCEDSYYVPTKVPAPNSAPEIIQFVAEPNNLLTGDTAKVYCVVNDANRDELGVHFSSTSGFVNYFQNRDTISYVPFDFVGDQYVALEIQDGEFYIRDTVLITHREWGDFDEMVRIPAGPVYLSEYDDEDMVDVEYHVDHDFMIGRYEVTNERYVQYLNDSFAAGLIWVDSSKVHGYFEGNMISEPGEYIYLEIFENRSIAELFDSIWFEDGAFGISSEFYNYPISAVSWYGANAFAAFYNLRLPTIKEWTRAARGNTTRSHTWGNGVFNSYMTNLCGLGTAPVGQKTERSIYGICDMSGNVSEWCSNNYYDQNENGFCGKNYGGRVPFNSLVCGDREGTDILFTFGFRVAKDID